MGDFFRDSQSTDHRPVHTVLRIAGISIKTTYAFYHGVIYSALAR